VIKTIILCVLSTAVAFAQAPRRPFSRDPVTLSVRDYGAAGDGQWVSGASPSGTDDTAAVQSAINDIALTGGTLVFPYSTGCYITGNLVINNSTDLTIRGEGAKICWTGTAGSGGNIGFQYTGTTTNLTIEGLEMAGDGIAADSHAGVYAYSGGTVSNIKIKNNYIHDVSLGISINAYMGGSVAGFEVSGNYIANVMGLLPGTGYGIHHANLPGLISNGSITDNTIIGAQRHSIYEASGIGVVISRNKIYNHRIGTPTASNTTPAIECARSQNVTITSNEIEYWKDGAITTDGGSSLSDNNIVVTDNVIGTPNPATVISAIVVGNTDPEPSGENANAIDVLLSGNKINMGGVGYACVDIYSGLHVTVNGNQCESSGTTAREWSGYVVRGYQETSGSAVYTQDLLFESNNLIAAPISGNAYLFEITSTAAASGIPMTFQSNSFSGSYASFVVDGGTLTDPDVSVAGEPADGLSGSVLSLPNRAAPGDVYTKS